MGTRRIGELLVADGVVTEAIVARALGYQRHSGERVKLGTILLNWDLLAEDALLQTLAKFHRCAAVDWETLSRASMEAVCLLTPAQAVRLGVLPYSLERGTLRIAMADPSNIAAIDEVSAIAGKRVVPAVTTEVRLYQAHRKFYGRHLPGTVRSIVLKLDRRTGSRASGVVPLIAPLEESPALPISAIPVEMSSAETAASPETISAPETTTGSSVPIEPLIEAAPMQSQEVAPEEDSLSRWVGDALSSFQQDPSGRPRADQPPPITADVPANLADLRLPERPDSADDDVAGMWRPSHLEDPDEVASSMWTSGDDMDTRLWEARSREEIGEALLQNALTHLPRVLLFGLGKSSITGWRGRGPGLSNEDVASVRVSAGEESVFTVVEKSGIPHFGPVEPADWPAGLFGLLGEKPLDCAIFPIRVLDGVAAFLYADRLGQPMLYQDFALVARATASTANILARFLLRPNTTPAV